MKNKILIAIEGLDGCGKATQSKLLAEYLRSNGYDARRITFPNYDSQSSALVKMYLNKEFSDNPNDISPYAASSFYAVDRYASYMQDWGKDYQDGKIIVSDRYTFSNAIYQMSKLYEWEYHEYLNWLQDYEFNKLGLPKPDTTILLHLPVEISQRLMSERYNNDESKKDLHESNVEYLQKCHDMALYIAERYKSWKTVECNVGDCIKSISDISNEIINIVKEVI